MGDIPFEHAVCPIVKWKISGDDQMEIQQVVGTAFNIGGNVYLTAKHCLLPENGGYPFAFCYQTDHDAPLIGEQVCEIERFDIDVSVARIDREIPNIKAFPWSFEKVSMLTDVWTAGFPHAFSSKEFGTIMHRAFKGHIVTNTPFQSLHFERKCRIYELSFCAPMGLSGAPLFCPKPRNAVVGLVFGNRATSLEVAKEIEAIDDGSSTDYYMYIQRYEYGTAITSREIGSLKSQMLGMTIEEYIDRQGLKLN